MKVLQLGVSGIRRYSDALHNFMPNSQDGINIDYRFIRPVPIFGGGLALELKTALSDFSGYGMVHNLSTYPFFPRKKKEFILVTTAHEMQPVLYPNLTRMRLHSFKDVLWEELVSTPGLKCLLSSDYVMATSKLNLDGVIKAGFPKDRAFLTPLGLDKKFLAPIRDNKGKKFKIGTLGTAGPQKNTFFSIDAVRKLKGDLSFEIWGNHIYSAKSLLERIGGDARIKLMGPAPESGLVKIYDSLDVFLFPSTFEGFGLPIIEAKSRGLPVIIMKGGHISPEVRKYCLEARDPEHMAEIISSIKANGYNHGLRKKAIASSRQFTSKRMAMATLDAYVKIVKETQGKADNEKN